MRRMLKLYVLLLLALLESLLRCRQHLVSTDGNNVSTAGGYLLHLLLGQYDRCRMLNDVASGGSRSAATAGAAGISGQSDLTGQCTVLGMLLLLMLGGDNWDRSLRGRD